MRVFYRVDHVGSLLRPPELLRARAKVTAPGHLEALEVEHISRLLAKQKELGFEIFTGGELRRLNFMNNFTDAVAGFDLGGEIARDWDASQAKPKVSAVTGIVNKTIRQVRPLTGHELPFLRKTQPGRDQDDAGRGIALIGQGEQLGSARGHHIRSTAVSR